MINNDAFSHELEEAVLSLGIPPCPQILIELAAEAKNEEPNLQKIEKLVCADVGISASLIKTVNSPFYGLRSKVHTVIQAVHVLGLPQLSLMVTGMVLRNALQGIGQLDMGRFWDSSTKVAIISSYIAARLPYVAIQGIHRQIDKDEAYTYGLFQDCGIPIMLNYHPEYKITLGEANQSKDAKFTDIEDAKYVNNHAIVGYMLAKSWGLPATMFQAIRYHHEYAILSEAGALSGESKNLIAVALLAEKAVQLITGLSQTCEWEKGGEWVLQQLGLSQESFDLIISGIQILSDEGSLSY